MNSSPISTYSGTGATNQWYNEIANYDFDLGKKIDESGQSTGHFTQVVWKTSQKIGCGAIESTEKISISGGNWYAATIICNYYPPGNFNNAYVQNVPKLLQDGTNPTDPSSPTSPSSPSDPSSPTGPSSPTSPSNPSNSTDTDSTGEPIENKGDGFALRLSKYLLMFTLVLFL